MRMPYESVRRKVNLLKREGLCQVKPKSGLLINVEAVDRRIKRLRIRERWLDSLKELVADLQRLGFDISRLPRPRRRARRLRMRSIVRIAGELDMQLFDIYAQLDGVDLIQWFIILTAWDFNVGDYYRSRNAEMIAAPDEERRPITVHKLATLIAMPVETTRRHVNSLLKRSILIRPNKSGVIVSQRLWSDARHRDAHRRICLQTARAMAELARQNAAIFFEKPRRKQRRRLTVNSSIPATKRSVENNN